MFLRRYQFETEIEERPCTVTYCKGQHPPKGLYLYINNDNEREVRIWMGTSDVMKVLFIVRGNTSVRSRKYHTGLK